MLSSIQTLLRRRLASNRDTDQDAERALRIATAALLLEVAAADDDVTEAERRRIKHIVEEIYAVSPQEARGIYLEAERQTGSATSLYPFTRLITSECSMEDRVEIVHRLWELTFLDGRIHEYEEHLVRKVADLLYVPHSQFIRGKIRFQDD
ncbi:MAG: TerB family tellurite resistance protein [Pseudomonadota bacterium]